MAASITSISFNIAGRISKQKVTVSIASNSNSFSSCMSLLYASGKPFIKVNTPIKSPKTRPDFPRNNSAMSGFFFCGMMLEPEENVSRIFTKPNSCDDQMMTSSARREMWTMMIDRSANISKEWSRSDTPSKLFREKSLNPSASAVKARSKGKVVVASAALPSGI